MAQRLRHGKLGIALVSAASVFFCLSGVFVKLIAVDLWTMLAWRGFWGGLIILLYSASRSRSLQGLRSSLGNWRLWLLACVGSLSSISFIMAFKFTTVANVTIIYALVPFATAMLERLFLRERIATQTLTAAFAGTLGVGILVAGNLTVDHFVGDALAFVMMLLNAVFAVLVRAFRKMDVVLAGGIAALQLFPIALAFANPANVTSHFFWALVVFGILFGMASVFWTEGAKLLTASEVAVLNTADIPLAIFLAWLFVSEVPTPSAIAGALIVIATLLAYMRWRANAPRRQETEA